MKARCLLFGHAWSGDLTRPMCERCGIQGGLPQTEQNIPMPPTVPPRRYDARCPTVQDCADAIRQEAKTELLDGLRVTLQIVGVDAYMNDAQAHAAVIGGMSVLGYLRWLQADRKRLIDEMVRMHQIMPISKLTVVDLGEIQ